MNKIKLMYDVVRTMKRYERLMGKNTATEVMALYSF